MFRGPQSFGSRRSVVLFAVLAVLAGTLPAQVSNATGNIQGAITDPSGAVVPEAKVTILNKATGRAIDSETTSSGVYTSESLLPGVYTVRIEAQGFQTTELTATVQVGVTTGGNIKLQVRTSDETVEVKGEEIRVNTEQATVQGVVTREQIETLPINGRNFRTAAASIPPRTASPPFLSVDALAVPPALRSTASTSAMKPSARPRKTSPPVPSSSSRSVSRLSICPPN